MLQTISRSLLPRWCYFDQVTHPTRIFVDPQIQKPAAGRVQSLLSASSLQPTRGLRRIGFGNVESSVCNVGRWIGVTSVCGLRWVMFVTARLGKDAGASNVAMSEFGQLFWMSMIFASGWNYWFSETVVPQRHRVARWC